MPVNHCTGCWPQGAHRPFSTKRVYSYKERILRQKTTPKGYKIIILSKNNIHETLRISRLVAIHFIINKYNKPQVNHIDGIKTNNYVGNLEWVNNSENQKHAYKIGLNKQKSGAENHGSKIVYQYDMNDNYLNKYGSIRIAAQLNNIIESNISQCANNHKHYYHAGGYKWKFKKIE